MFYDADADADSCACSQVCGVNGGLWCTHWFR